MFEKGIKKKRKVTLGKYQVKKGKHIGNPSFLVYFSQRGGPDGYVHTHKWHTTI